MVIAVFTLVTVFVSIKLLPLVTTKQPIPPANNAGGKGPTSPFRNVGRGMEEQLLEEMKVFSASENPDYFLNWSKDKVIFAHIEEIDKIANDIVVKILPPQDQPFSSKRWTLHVQCPKDKTLAVSAQNTFRGALDYNFNILDKAEVGNIIIGYCLEEECLNIGNKCYLVVRK